LKHIVHIAILVTFTCAALAAFSNSAQAQKIDIAFGVSTTIAPSASFVGGSETAPSLSGGAFPGVSGDVLFWHNLGVGGEVFWRGSSANCSEAICGFDSGITYRPVLYNFNAVYSPKIAPHAYLELVGGLGALDTHYSECTLSGASCGGSQLISSSNHFDVDLGGGVKLYVHKGFFVRPEARFYWINNNTDYSSNHAGRVGASIGYTFR
jgi:outer membrane protein with beta-barrel domain